MIDPATLKRNPDRLYTFKSLFKTLVMRWVDVVGSLFFSTQSASIPWQNLKRIAVLRLDHLGDVLLALPAVKALEEALPNVQVDLIIGPWAKDIVDRAGLRSTPKIFSASWFSREGSKDGRRELARLLREGKYDAVIELRGDFRHILAMYQAGVKYRVGLARTGFGFLLTQQLVFRPGQHEMDRNFETMERAGIHLAQKPGFPQLYPRKDDEQAQKEVRQKLGVTKLVIALHSTCLAPSKRWPVAHWQKLIEKLPADRDIVLIGTEGEKPGMEEIVKGCQRKVFVAAGLLNLGGLAAFLKDCQLFIGVDSGPAHIAAAVGTPVLSLYSGTNLVGQWGPKGPKVTVLQKTTPCSPCELVVCPIENECMKLIEVDEVLRNVNESLK